MSDFPIDSEAINRALQDEIFGRPCNFIKQPRNKTTYLDRESLKSGVSSFVVSILAQLNVNL